MNAFEFRNVNEMYRHMTQLLFKEKLVNGTKELSNVLITVNDITNPIVNIREISVPYLCGELMWYTFGVNDVDFISRFAKKWSEITDDGETNNSAYGYIIQRKHGFNQLRKIVELLKKDRSSRRAVINLNVPNKNVIETKDEICTIALQFLIRDKKLHCTAIMRSNDIYTGMPYDIAFFVSLQKIIADKLDIECGKYNHFVTSLHMYEKTENKLQRLISNDFNDGIKLNSLNLLKLTEEDYSTILYSKYPKSEIVKLFIEKNIIEGGYYEN